jgi:hypothetical protein
MFMLTSYQRSASVVDQPRTGLCCCGSPCSCSAARRASVPSGATIALTLAGGKKVSITAGPPLE